MSDPNDLAEFLDGAWQHVRRGAADSRSPARYPTFATVSPEGLPEARTVALRRADRASSVLEVHTDINTPKVRALEVRPVAALHIWLPKPRLQIRLSADVTLQTGPEVEAAWAKIPPASRVSYGTRPDPGQPIPSVHAYEKPPARERFAVLLCAINHIDLVELHDPHRRAEYRRDDDWQGAWLAP